MEKKLHILSIFFLVCCFFFSGCHKSDQKISHKTKSSKSKNLSIADARIWFDSNSYRILAEEVKMNSFFGNVIPLWAKAKIGEDDQFFIVETAVRFSSTPGFINKSASGGIQSSTSLVVFKNKMTEEIFAVLMNIVPDRKMPPAAVNYFNRKGFSGTIFYTLLDGRVSNGWKYKDGKITAQSGASTTNEEASRKELPPDCEIVGTAWYKRVCTYYDDNTVECTPWEYSHTVYTTYCPSNGGGSGGYNAPDPCSDACMDEFNKVVSQSHVSAIDGGATIININGLKKYKNPKWQILDGWSGWSLWSQENGMVELVDPDANKWVWLKLNHGSISMIGTRPPGVAITHSQGEGTPSFVEGTPNILYAGMNLDFTVTYSFVCSSCPMNNLVSPKIKDYTVTKIWDAKP